jgi:hypothetical protein
MLSIIAAGFGLTGLLKIDIGKRRMAYQAFVYVAPASIIFPDYFFV